MSKPSIVFLNMTGDITITWDAQNEDAILALVEKKMKEGYSFFILKPRITGLLGKKKVAIENVEDARRAGHIVAPDALANKIMAKLGDEDVEAVVASGQAQVKSQQKVTDLDTVRRAKDAKEVTQSQTVAVRRIVGG